MNSAIETFVFYVFITCFCATMPLMGYIAVQLLVYFLKEHNTSRLERILAVTGISAVIIGLSVIFVLMIALLFGA